MRFHYMFQGGEDLVGGQVVWDWVGYESVLFTFGVGDVDNFLRCFRVLDVGHSFSFMLALRPFHVSVDFFCMLVRSWNEVAQGRLVVNFLAGQDTVDQLGGVDVLGGALGGVVERRGFVRDFMGGVVEGLGVGVLPGFVVSGFSEFSVGSARLFGCPVLCMLADFRDFRGRFGVGGLNMVCVNLVLRDSVVEAEGVLDGLILGSLGGSDRLGVVGEVLVRERLNSLVGDSVRLRELLLGLGGEGVTDVLVSVFPGDWGRLGLYHEFLRGVVGGG